MNFYPEFNIAREIYTNKSLFKYVTSVVLYKYTGTGWPRHRENREFGSYFFQTGKTQGILF